MSEHPNDSVKLGPVIADSTQRDKRELEKWLIYCPAVASDTLLLFITQGESYSLRSYGGKIGVNATGRHAEGAHSTSEFHRIYEPELVVNVEHAELAVQKTDKWQRNVAGRWSDYVKVHPELA